MSSPPLPNDYVLGEKLRPLAERVADLQLSSGSRPLDRQVAVALGLYGYNPENNGAVNTLQARSANGVLRVNGPAVPRYTSNFDPVLSLVATTNPRRITLDPGRHRTYDCQLEYVCTTAEAAL